VVRLTAAIVSRVKRSHAIRRGAAAYYYPFIQFSILMYSIFHFTKRFPLSIAGLAFLASETAVAKTTTDDTLETLEVRGIAENKLEDSFRFFTGGATFLNASGPQEGRSASVSDALGKVPGVFAQPRFGPLDTRLSIRGSGMVRTGHGKGLQLLWAGIPFNQADGNFDAHLFDLFAVEAVTITRGGGAYASGNATLGGSIAIIPLTGRTADRGRLRGEVGSFGYRSAAASSGYATDLWDVFVATGYAEADGYRRQSRNTTRRVTGNVGRRLSDNHEIRLLFNAIDTRTQWPGALTEAEFREDPRQAAVISERRNQGLSIEQGLIGLESTRVLPNGLRLFSAVGLNYKREDHPTPGAILDLITRDGSLRLELQAEELSTLNWRLGIAPTIGYGHEKRFNYAGPPASANASQRGSLASEADRKAYNLVAYGSLEYALATDLSIELGAQYIRSVRRAQGRGTAAPISPDYRFSDERLQPRVGIRYKLTEDASVFASYSSSFEAPTFFDLSGNASLQADGRPRLDAQTAQTFEIGTRGEHRALLWDIVAYHSRVRNELLRLDPAAGFGSPIINAPRVERSGLESGIGFRMDLNSDVSITPYLVYNYNRFRFDDDPQFGNNDFAGLPEHRILLSNELALSDRFYLTPSMEWVPDGIWIDNANTLKSEGYTVFHLRFGYRPANGWRAFVDLRNLTDRRYSPTVNVLARADPNSAVYFPADGRSVYLGMEYRW